jgi:hypothetical protein
MRTTLLAVAASLAIVGTGAFAQPNCSETYGTCMNGCVSKPGLAQDRCIEACQAKSNQCYERVWGARPQAVIGNQPASAPDAMATGDKTSPVKANAAAAPNTAPAAAKQIKQAPVQQAPAQQPQPRQ